MEILAKIGIEIKPLSIPCNLPGCREFSFPSSAQTVFDGGDYVWSEDCSFVCKLE